MKLEFKGIVYRGNPYRQNNDLDDPEPNGAVHVGGADVVDEIAERKWGKNTRVTLNGKEVANGKVVAETGWAYSEYTPMETDTACVGKCNLIELLEELEGQEAHLIVSDEP